MVAKIADLGVARIATRARAAATMTKGPRALPYMPPEAIRPSTSNTEEEEGEKEDGEIVDLADSRIYCLRVF